MSGSSTQGLYAVKGTVEYTKPKDGNGFQSFMLNMGTQTVQIKYNFFLPVRYGDQFSGTVLIISDNIFLQKDPFPEVNIPNNDDSVFGCIRTALGGKNLDRSIPITIVRVLRAQKQNEESLCECIDRLAQKFVKDKDESTLEMFDDLSYREEIIPKFYKWWLANRCLRKLYLLSINKGEIRRSGLDPVALYQKCLRNPYTVVSLDLKKCEDICKRINKRSTFSEIKSGEILRFIHRQSSDNGHAFVFLSYLNQNFPDLTDHKELLENEYGVVFDQDRVYKNSLFKDEIDVARFISDALKDTKNDFGNVEISPLRSEDQKNAILSALENRISIITGEAGTGKTSCLEELCLILERAHIPYALGAFTGKAVSRIREKTGRMKAKTLHRMIKEKHVRVNLMKISEARDLTEKEEEIVAATDPEFILIDEASMVTISLLAEIIRTFPSLKSIIFIGDNNQLPPIGSGALFEQLLLSKRVPTFHLTRNFRILNQDGGLNGVINNAKAIIERKPHENFSFQEGSNFFVCPGTLENIKSMMLSYRDANIDMRKLVFLCPYNEQIRELNKYAQEIFSVGKKFLVDSRKNKWALGDPVIMTENDAEIDVFNGESGIIEDINELEQSIVINFGYGRTHEFPLESKEEKEQNFFEEDNVDDYERTVKKLQLAYALTVHKSQGSEWENVIFFVPPGKKPGLFLNNRLIYTAWTRTRGSILNICESTILSVAATIRAPKRNDHLAERLSNLPQLYNEDLIADPSLFEESTDWQDEVDLDF